MVQAILEGRKTQTRRVIRPQPEGITESPYCIEPGSGHSSRRCPYGTINDWLWVRETWAPWPNPPGYIYRADNHFDAPKSGWRPSIHMPREASRLTLRVTGAHIECVQDISNQDARAEGASGLQPVAAFAKLWDAINAKRGFGWEVNPYCWVVAFELIER
jgi:hypothetical protein